MPISGIEAQRLKELVDDMPEPRASEVRARFAAARAQLEHHGLLPKLLDPQLSTDEELQTLGLEYFALGIACPLLEDESCSIHSERPIACREYLVTSPAKHCSTPDAENVKCVKMPAKASRALRLMEPPTAVSSARWVPLIVALEWAETHPDETQLRSGKEIAAEFFTRLTRADSSRTPEHRCWSDS